MYLKLCKWLTFAFIVLLMTACGGRSVMFADDDTGDTDSLPGSSTIDTDTEIADTGQLPQYPLRAVTVSSGAGTVTSENYKCRMSVGGTPKAGAVSATYKAELGVGPVLSLKTRGTP